MAKAIIVGFFAETDLHPGAGQGLGTIDQPVQREGGTGFPVVPATSHKGAVRSELTEGKPDHQLVPLFGRIEQGQGSQSGSVAFGDIRLLLLPMRCSESTYKWVTTPTLLERFDRDVHRAGGAALFKTIPRPSQNELQVAGGAGGTVHIEEFQFAAKPLANGKEVVDAVGKLLPNDAPYDKVGARLGQQIAIMNDDDFAWFCQYGLPVQPHNHLDPDTKESRNLWYEEYLPSDTLLYAINTPRAGRDADLDSYARELGKRKFLQIGGNETTGEGVCRINIWQVG
ncbi:MAG: type III-B CRISPR module RAMP protein Cmr4 [Enhydrobacter sp.]|nr:MAG: type III-B CRISPR module RAMP protein Cmr4 [Enhydrobacter sp.]